MTLSRKDKTIFQAKNMSKAMPNPIYLYEQMAKRKTKDVSMKLYYRRY